MRVIIIGASGLIGINLFNYLNSKKIKTIGTYFKNKTHKKFIKFDISKDIISKNVKNINKKDIFIIFSACTNPSWISKNKKYAKKINIVSTKRIIKQINKFKSKIIFMSSVEVFDGGKKNFYESDTVNPLNYYGKTKLEIENYIKKNCKSYLICRTSWNSALYLHDRCVIELTYKTILKKNAMMAQDNIFSITHVNDLCKVLYNNLNSKRKILHISNTEKITRFELAKKIKSLSRLKKKMNFQNVKFSQIKYKEPRALKNLLRSKERSISNNFKFLKIGKMIKKKVMLLDKIN